MHVSLGKEQSDGCSVNHSINTAQYANNPLTSRPLSPKPAFVYKYLCFRRENCSNPGHTLIFFYLIFLYLCIYLRKNVFIR